MAETKDSEARNSIGKLLERVEMAARNVGSHPWFLRGIFVAGVATVGALYLWPQAPGVAVGVLAVGAIIMTFREMTATHKLLWSCFAMALLFLEYRAIYREHQQQEIDARTSMTALLGDNRAKTRSILDDNRNKTKAILDDNAVRFAATETQFGQIGRLSKSGLASSQSAIAMITGANSYPYIMPLPSKISVGLFLRSRGPNPITGVGVEITDDADNGGATSFSNIGSTMSQSIGNAFARLAPTLKSNEEHGYTLIVTAQNGSYLEGLKVRKVKEGENLQVRYVLQKMTLPRLDNQPMKLKVLETTDWYDGDPKNVPTVWHGLHK